MTPRIEGFLLIGALFVLSFVLQVQMKMFSGEVGPLVAGLRGATFSQALSSVAAVVFGWRFLSICVLSAAIFAVWIGALMRFEMSVAIPVASIALIINSVGGGLLLGESISASRALGILISAIGIGLVLRT